MPRIHCLNNISPKGLEALPDCFDIVDEIDQADALFVRSAKLHDLEFPDSLVAIARAGAGVNNIPLERCASEGIVVFNTPGANANAVKELVLCGMFLGSRGIIAGSEWCREHAEDPEIGKLAEKAKKAFAGREILGKKLGVIGLGAIGALVANAATDLGMTVLGYDPYVSVDAAWRLSQNVRHVIDLETLCAECDYLTIHVPALDATKGMIGKEQITTMKQDAVLLNFSRDSLVDEEAIVEALKAETLGCYITDFANPTIMKAPADRAIVLPHLGASTAEAEENCAVMAAHEVVDFIQNGNIFNSVNYPDVNLGVVRSFGQRITVAHRNEPGVINGVTEAIAGRCHNVANIISRAKGDYAYAIIDIDDTLGEDAVEKLSAHEGVLRIRLV